MKTKLRKLDFRKPPRMSWLFAPVCATTIANTACTSTVDGTYTLLTFIMPPSISISISYMVIYNTQYYSYLCRFVYKKHLHFITISIHVFSMKNRKKSLVLYVGIFSISPARCNNSSSHWLTHIIHSEICAIKIVSNWIFWCEREDQIRASETRVCFFSH